MCSPICNSPKREAPQRPSGGERTHEGWSVHPRALMLSAVWRNLKTFTLSEKSQAQILWLHLRQQKCKSVYGDRKHVRVAWGPGQVGGCGLPRGRATVRTQGNALYPGSAHPASITSHPNWSKALTNEQWDVWYRPSPPVVTRPSSPVVTRPDPSNEKMTKPITLQVWVLETCPWLTLKLKGK